VRRTGNGNRHGISRGIPVTFIIAIALLANPWLGPHSDWAPLYERYSYCQTAMPAPVFVRFCMAEAYHIASSHTVDA
jgi:hypothetical protein